MQAQDQPPNEEIYHGQLINLRIQRIEQASAGTSRFEIVEHPGGVAIVALRNDVAADGSSQPYVVLVYQHRPAIGKYCWEIPAGMVEPEERNTPELTASREFYEETGYSTDVHKLEYLVREYSSPGFSNETITIFLAREVHLTSNSPADPTEITRVRWIPLSEALELCLNHEIEDGKTQLGLFLTDYILTKERLST